MRRPVIALVLGHLYVSSRALPFGDSTPELDKRQNVGVFSSCTVSNTAALTFDDGPYNWLQVWNFIILSLNVGLTQGHRVFPTY